MEYPRIKILEHKGKLYLCLVAKKWELVYEPGRDLDYERGYVPEVRFKTTPICTIFIKGVSAEKLQKKFESGEYRLCFQKPDLMEFLTKQVRLEIRGKSNALVQASLEWHQPELHCGVFTQPSQKIGPLSAKLAKAAYTGDVSKDPPWDEDEKPYDSWLAKPLRTNDE